MAAQAGRAAPAVAIAGALVAGPQAQHALADTAAPAAPAAAPALPAQQAAHAMAHAASATLDAFSARAVTVASAVKARHAAQATSTHYTVRAGDTLSGIAERFYHKAADWQYLYHENARTVSDPDLIYVGQQLLVPATAPANFTLTDYVPRHARPAVTSDADGDDAGTSGTPAASTPAPAASTPAPAPAAGSGGGGRVVVQSASQGGSGSAGGLSGTLSCSGLEQLWVSAGGSPSAAFMAAEIAMAESGGNQYAHSPTNDYGYWQINASNGALATFDAYGNARSAIILSHNGTDWYPWTTYTSGVYAGRC